MNEHAQSAAAQSKKDFKKIRKALKERDLQECCWEMLTLAMDDVEATGKSETFGKTGLLELVRVLSIQKNTENMSERMDKVTELKEWLRKQA
jgi:hypothetical protein